MTTTSKSTKMTKEQAVAILAAAGLDTMEGALAAVGEAAARKWGESERQPAIDQTRGKSHGLVVNAAIHYDVATTDSQLAEAARVAKVLTRSDWGKLRAAAADE